MAPSTAVEDEKNDKDIDATARYENLLADAMKQCEVHEHPLLKLAVDILGGSYVEDFRNMHVATKGDHRLLGFSSVQVGTT